MRPVEFYGATFIAGTSAILDEQFNPIDGSYGTVSHAGGADVGAIRGASTALCQKLGNSGKGTWH